MYYNVMKHHPEKLLIVSKKKWGNKIRSSRRDIQRLQTGRKIKTYLNGIPQNFVVVANLDSPKWVTQIRPTIGSNFIHKLGCKWVNAL